MTEVIIFKTKEDGAKFFRGEKNNCLRKTFKSQITAISFAQDMVRYLSDEESIVLREVKENHE